jgi:triacylglycerol lipase
MLARLQQATTLGLIALAALWAVLFLRVDRPGWAWAGAALILFGYALFLAVEFVLLRLIHGTDPAPRASARELFTAWCGEVVSAPRVFCWRQPFRSTSQPDYLPAQGHHRRGVVLVHGFVCNRGLWNPWMHRMRAAGTPFIAVNLEPVFGSIDDYRATIDAAVQRLWSLTGLAPVVVAHSMGGLAVRAWLASVAADDRVHRVVTIGTPHSGTWLARFAVPPNARQMRQHSAWLEHLASMETEARRARFVCFYGHCDNIVFPPSTATLAGADNHHLRAVAHVHMASHPAVFSEVERWLASPASVADAAVRAAAL